MRLCLTVRIRGTFCCAGLKALNWRLTNGFQFGDPRLAVAEAVALGEDDLQRLAAQFLTFLDGHGRGAVAARVVGDLALADVEQGLLAGDCPCGAGRQQQEAGSGQSDVSSDHCWSSLRKLCCD